MIATQSDRIKELEEALSAAEKMLSGIYLEIELPGEWETGVSECIDAAREVLAVRIGGAK